MKNRLCSEGYLKFFSCIDKIGLSTEELVDVIRDNMPLIADDIDLGKLNIRFYTPPTPLESEGHDVEIVLFENDFGYEEASETRKFDTSSGGLVTFTAHSKKGIIWDTDGKENLDFLLKNIFAMCGRARLSDIVKKSLSCDMSTGLVNANGFVATGNRLAANGTLHEYTAFYINLKNFKYINGQIGNRYGDTVIRKYAHTLAKLVGNDGITARLGGDNFTVLIKKARVDDILDYLSGTDLEIEIAGSTSHFSMQARAGMYDIKEGDAMPHVMNCISAAISTARRHPTKHIITFTPEVLYKIMQEQEITASFPVAIRNKEFLVYFQPKVDLKTRELCGCEALVRWLKDGKLIPPMNFIPLFEHNGSICSLDFYMLESVCRSICEWKSKGIEPVTVSVNFSKTHLHNPNIAEDILKIIRKYDIESRYIEIEMTEMSDFNDYEAFRNLVNKLKANGVTTSIDDFGTGYSSLNLLTDFMFDIVKLDKSFIDNIIRNNSKTDEIVVRNIVRMINELKMTSIAEGVETAEQADFLEDIGCGMVQGYLFDRPLPEEEFINRLKTRAYKNVV